MLKSSRLLRTWIQNLLQSYFNDLFSQIRQNNVKQIQVCACLCEWWFDMKWVFLKRIISMQMILHEFMIASETVMNSLESQCDKSRFCSQWKGVQKIVLNHILLKSCIKFWHLTSDSRNRFWEFYAANAMYASSELIHSHSF